MAKAIYRKFIGMPSFHGLSLYILNDCRLQHCKSIPVNLLAVGDAGINLCQPKQ
jgi:hypothetical protein